MHYVRTIRSLFAVPADNPELARSQIQAVSRQMPLLYLIVVANTIALAATHLGTAPAVLAVYIPVLLCLFCVRRLASWWSVQRRPMSNEEAVRQFRVVTRRCALVSAALVCFALSLFPYGDAYAQAHVAFFLFSLLVGGIFCLAHLRSAALVVTLIVVVPFAAFFGATGRPVFIAVAVTVVLVATAMMSMVFAYFQDFANLTQSKKDLVARQAETQRLSDENLRLANLDSLTGLPNRRHFFADLDASLERAARQGRRFAVGLFDLDGFKPVNDAYGHVTGDRVLVEAGCRLRQLCGPAASLARLGGDEFGLILDGEPADADILGFGRRLCESLQVPYTMPDVVARLSCSAGFVTYPQGGRDAAQLFERADYALYHAKEHCRGSASIFSAEHETEIRHLSRVEQELRRADLERELSLVFQPTVDVDAQRTTGFEALARWQSPTLGAVPPDVFIKVAERSDLINRLTECLLRRALADAYVWPPEIGISFNLSTRDVSSAEAILRIIAVVRRSQVEPRRITFEVTETAVMRDFEQACKTLLSLKHLGAKLALDDFGSGYSSLSYVHRLPIDRIKIDRSFIADIETARTSRNIVKTVVDLCRNLDLDCVVEGTETAAQLSILRELGCKLVQGYYFAKPMAAAEVMPYLDAEPGRFAEAREPRRLTA